MTSPTYLTSASNTPLNTSTWMQCHASVNRFDATFWADLPKHGLIYISVYFCKDCARPQEPLLDVLKTATKSSPLLFNPFKMTSFGVQSYGARTVTRCLFFLFRAVIRGDAGAAILNFPSHITLSRFSRFSLPLAKKIPGKFICMVNF